MPKDVFSKEAIQTLLSQLQPTRPHTASAALVRAVNALANKILAELGRLTRTLFKTALIKRGEPVASNHALAVVRLFTLSGAPNEVCRLMTSEALRAATRFSGPGNEDLNASFTAVKAAVDKGLAPLRSRLTVETAVMYAAGVDYIVAELLGSADPDIAWPPGPADMIRVISRDPELRFLLSTRWEIVPASALKTATKPMSRAKPKPKPKRTAKPTPKTKRTATPKPKPKTTPKTKRTATPKPKPKTTPKPKTKRTAKPKAVRA
jgi:hypothetical protein